MFNKLLAEAKPRHPLSSSINIVSLSGSSLKGGAAEAHKVIDPLMKSQNAKLKGHGGAFEQKPSKTAVRSIKCSKCKVLVQFS